MVGEPRPGGESIPPPARSLCCPGRSKQITLRMAMEFEGKFTVKALNPTTLATYVTLDLETDYTV